MRVLPHRFAASMMRTALHLRQRAKRGVTLVELMVALALGLLVTGVVLANYLGSRQAQRTSVTLSRMTDDANLVFSLMRRYASMAGYSAPIGVVANGASQRLDRPYPPNPIFGCDSPFSPALTRPVASLQCDATGGPDALVLSYQATAQNSLVGRRDGSGIDEPRDALGRFLYVSGGGAEPDYNAQVRFTVNANDQLILNTNGGNANGANVLAVPAPDLPAGATLLENVRDLRFWYGIQGNNGAVNRYVSAQSIGAPNAADWANVRAIRVCLLLASAEEVLEEPTGYYDCEALTSAAPALTEPAAGATPAQLREFRRLHRAFVTTIYVPNNLVP